MSRLLAKFTSRTRGSEDDSTSSSNKASNDAHNRRREQVRRAQRTHRERRAKYLQGLEAEVAHLRSKDAKNIMELKKTRTINKRLKALLDANNIPLPSDLEAIDPATSTTTIRVHGAAGGPQKLQPPASQAQMAPGIAVDLTDPQVAIEFILALEEPCLIDYHNHIGEDGETGHAMLLQSSVLQYAPTTVPTALGQQFPTGSCWNVPRAQLEEQLDSLLNTSMRLNLKGEMTPVMCWNKLRERHKLRPITRAQFQQLQKDLVLAVFCYGFGAVIDEKPFHATLDRTLPAT